MIGLRKTLWTTLALAALPAPAFAQEMCAALDRIAAASGDPVPFASLVDAARSGDLVPGFGEQDCQVTAGTSISCFRNLASPALELDAMERTLRDCLRRAPVTRTARPGLIPDRELVFVASGLRYRVSNDCDRRCRAGLLAYFEIAFEAAARSGE